MRARSSSVLIALLVCCFACAAAIATGAAGGEVRLQAGQTTTMDSPALQISFEGVASDSRCRKGEACIWEGDAAVRLSVTGASGTQAFELHTSPKKGSDVAGYEDWTIRLVALEPLPIAGREIAREAYVATFRVECGSAAPDLQ